MRERWDLLAHHIGPATQLTDRYRDPVPHDQALLGAFFLAPLVWGIIGLAVYAIA